LGVAESWDPLHGECRVVNWLGRVGGGARDVDATGGPPVDDFVGGSGSKQAVDELSSLPLLLLLLLLNVRCTLFKKTTNTNVAIQTVFESKVMVNKSRLKMATIHSPDILYIRKGIKSTM